MTSALPKIERAEHFKILIQKCTLMFGRKIIVERLGLHNYLINQNHSFRRAREEKIRLFVIFPGEWKDFGHTTPLQNAVFASTK